MSSALRIPSTHYRSFMIKPEPADLVTEFPNLPYREVYVQPYRFFYKVVEKTVWIVAVWHGAQIPEAPWERNGA